MGVEREMSEDMTLCSVLNEMRLEGSLCDVVLRVDKVEFKVHKNILSGYSPYFRALFTRWSSLDQMVYTITGVSPDIMDLIIHYIYTQDIQFTTDNAQALLVMADYLLIRDLVCTCCDFLKAHLSPDNCLGIWQYADAHSYYELRDRAYTYVLHHFEDIVRSPSSEFLELTVAQLGNILEKDELNINQEKTAFRAIIKWIEHESNVRMQHIVDLLPKVRLALINPEYFLENIKKNLLVSSFWECQLIITRAMKALYYTNMAGPNSGYPDPLTRPRLPYSILFAIGGFSGAAPTNIVETYDSRMDSWMCISSAEQRARAYHGTVLLDDFVYIIGGFDSMEYFNTVCKFNPLDGTWNEVAPMHSRRCYVSVAMLDGYIYAMGGFDGLVRLNTAERYQPSTNQWSLIPSMHEQRSDASATTLKGKIYICGGFNGNECLFTAECFDPHHDQWTLIEPMHTRRSGVGVIALNNQVFAIGGFDGANRLQSIEAYNPRTNSWRMLASMFNPRSNFGIEVMEGRLYVVGGYSGEGTTSNCECYDEDTDDWFNVRDMNIFRSAVSCCVISGLPNVTEYTVTRDGLL
ncbi:kelch-like protein 10 [Pangasianodon hypophthalmus]|uniref:kelch-like protein 10 n=1 Tax=Pangasianodon hypophthalmus TaxID=310915 RepID=UPI0023081FC7|nr:kelch-like protein 10 [Pangasianodon hypophthalmus]